MNQQGVRLQRIQPQPGTRCGCVGTGRQEEMGYGGGSTQWHIKEGDSRHHLLNTYTHEIPCYVLYKFLWSFLLLEQFLGWGNYAEKTRNSFKVTELIAENTGFESRQAGSKRHIWSQYSLLPLLHLITNKQRQQLTTTECSLYTRCYSTCFTYIALMNL